jgi:hypothetical protein
MKIGLPSFILIFAVILLSGCSMLKPRTTTESEMAENTLVADSTSDVTDSQASETQQSPINPDAINELLTGATVKVPGTQHEVRVTADSPVASYGEGTVTVAGQAVKSGNVIFSMVAITPTGSPLGDEPLYLAAFEPGANGWEMKDAMLIGNQIRLQNLQVIDDRITLDYFERGANQARFEVPNVAVRHSYVYTNGRLTVEK